MFVLKPHQIIFFLILGFLGMITMFAFLLGKEELGWKLFVFLAFGAMAIFLYNLYLETY
jgi:hypothetical protein